MLRPEFVREEEIMASTAPTSAPASTLAIVLRHPSQSLRLETLDLKPLHADEALIEVHATGVCHTDLSCLDGTLPIPMPIVLGHEGTIHTFSNTEAM